jgi:hypothetical protein
MSKNEMRFWIYGLELAAISKRFQLESSDWTHFQGIFNLFPDLTSFWKIDSAE